MSERTFVVFDPGTGLHLRRATLSESRTYRRLNPSRTWERPTHIGGGVWVNTHHGQGLWFGGAGF